MLRRVFKKKLNENLYLGGVAIKKLEYELQ